MTCSSSAMTVVPEPSHHLFHYDVSTWAIVDSGDTDPLGVAGAALNCAYAVGRYSWRPTAARDLLVKANEGGHGRLTTAVSTRDHLSTS